MLEFLLWFISQFDYTVGTEIKLNLNNEVDSLHASTVICEDRQLPNVKVLMPIDFSILGKHIYFARYDDPTDIKSGICTQFTYSMTKFYFRIDGGTFYSINKYIISDTREHLIEDINSICRSGVGVHHDTRMYNILNGLKKEFNLKGFTFNSTAGVIYVTGDIISDVELSDSGIESMYSIEKKYNTHISKHPMSDHGQFRVYNMRIFPDNIIIVNILNKGDLLLNVNLIPNEKAY